MKHNWRTISSVFAAVSALAMGSGRLHAQIIEISGSITAVCGDFVGVLNLGTPVVVALDLRAPLVDELPADERFGLFLGRRIGLRIDGRSYPVDAWPSEVLISCGFDGRFAGLSVGADWPAIEHPRVVLLGLMGDTDRVVSDSAFPEGIPLEHFTSREGCYLAPEGTISWTIDRYAVAASTPVPESGTYGMAAVASLIGLLAWRRWRKATVGARA